MFSRHNSDWLKFLHSKWPNRARKRYSGSRRNCSRPIRTLGFSKNPNRAENSFSDMRKKNIFFFIFFSKNIFSKFFFRGPKKFLEFFFRKIFFLFFFFSEYLFSARLGHFENPSVLIGREVFLRSSEYLFLSQFGRLLCKKIQPIRIMPRKHGLKWTFLK